VDDFNVVTYDIEESSIMEALSDAQTIPFMSTKKAVVIRNVNFEELEEATEYQLTTYLNNPPNFCELLIVPNQKLNGKLKIVKLLKEKSKVYELGSLETEQLEHAVIRFLEKRDIKIEKRALVELLRRTGEDTQRVMNEISKFENYYSGGGSVKLKDVKELVTKNIEDSVYNLTNAIIDKKKNAAMEIYYDLLQTEDPLRMLNLIINKFRELNYAKNLISKGYKKEEIQKFFNATPGRTYYIMKNAKNIKVDYIENQLEKLSKLDYDIKSGLIDKTIGVELYLLSI